MRFTFLLALLFCITAVCPAQKPKKITGEGIINVIYRYKKFPSQLTERRTVDVWLPLNYSKDKKFAVLYVNDGQNMFNPKDAYQGIEWGIDEVLGKLIDQGRARDTIVVGIWSNGNRLKEFAPEKAFALVNDRNAKSNKYIMPPGTGSDSYLKFIVSELKPFIDRNFSTLSDRENTFVMGSSMGGLMALYTISEYPEVFGGAACVSPHFPLGEGVMIDYMAESLPAPAGHRIYFDYGTLGLDAEYEPFQKRADKLMAKKGYVRGKNWITRKINGAGHSEIYWSLRAFMPLEFLLKK